MLEKTGERIIVAQYQGSVSDYLIYLFHLVTYEFARDYVRNGTVLDYGCGSGYGTAMLAKDCRQIIGVDVSIEAIAASRDNYAANNLSYLPISRAERAPLPFRDASFSTVLSFQVIEHIEDVDSYLSEIRRVLCPGGLFLLATPDRSTRLFSFQKPWNRWHVKEYSGTSLRSLLARYFGDVDVQVMGGDQEVLGIEFRRTRRLRWLTLPFTLPFIPERVRVACLSLLKMLNRPRGELGKKEFPFGVSALSISRDIRNGANLVAIARKTSQIYDKSARFVNADLR